MNFPFYIAKRYTISFSKNSAINTITIISSIAIVVSAMALFIFLSVFSGLREFSLGFTNASDPDLKIEPKSGKSFLLSNDEQEKLKSIENVAFYSKCIEDRVLFKYGDKEQIASIKGVDDFFTKTIPIEEFLFSGNWLEKKSNDAIIGYEIARKLSIGLFDYNNSLSAYTLKPGSDLIQNNESAYNQASLLPTGIYKISEDVDNKCIYTSFDVAKKLLNYDTNEVSSIECKMKNQLLDIETKEEIAAIFNKKVVVKTRAQLNDSLYKMLNSENLFIYLFSTLVVIMTLFCLAGAIVMIIIDKKENIHTLYNIGLSMKKIRKIFFMQGIIITIGGLLLGLLLGSLLIITQQQFSLFKITDTIPYPVLFKFENIIIVTLTILILGTLSSWIASGRIKKQMI